MNAVDTLKARWNAWWPGLAQREQRLVMAAAALAALALLWWVGLAPALRTLSTASAAHAQLDTQLQQMLALQAQARTLQSQPRANRDEALRTLETSVGEVLGGNARVQGAGGAAAAAEGVLVTLRATPAENFAQWLAQARVNARAVPREIHMTRSQAAAGAPAAAASAPVAVPSVNAGPPSNLALSMGPQARSARPSTPPPAFAPAPAATVNAATPGMRWDGTLVMSLPGR
jgi:general secretion pathway protein M